VKHYSLLAGNVIFAPLLELPTKKQEKIAVMGSQRTKKAATSENKFQSVIKN
jgi:hypothetical protein